MIVFDLQCGLGHVFEAWLASSAAYEEQRAGGLLCCPVCGDSEVRKAVMAPAVSAKGNRQPSPPEKRIKLASGPEASIPLGANLSPRMREEMARLMHRMAQAQARALENSHWVGDDFAEQARSMHYGEREHRPIHGTASPDEARALVDEGLPVAPLPFPVIAPDKRN